MIKKKRKFRPLTIKQAKFLKIYIETGNATEAAMVVYKCKNRLSARNIGSENLAKLGILTILQAELTQAGLTREYRIKRLKGLIDSEDWQSVAKGLDISFKLTNEYPRENSNF